MLKDIKKIVDAAKAAGATIATDCRVTNVTIFPAATGKNVDYWITLSVNQALRGMIADKKDENGNIVTYKEGLTTTVTSPLGTLVSCLFDALLDMDNDDALDLLDYKRIIIADAEKEALADDAHPYTSPHAGLPVHFMPNHLELLPAFCPPASHILNRDTKDLT